MDGPVGADRLINILQALAKRMGNDPDDRVGLRVEIAASPQRFGCDPVFMDLVVVTEEVLFADICEHAGKIAGLAKHA